MCKKMLHDKHSMQTSDCTCVKSIQKSNFMMKMSCFMEENGLWLMLAVIFQAHAVRS